MRTDSPVTAASRLVAGIAASACLLLTTGCTAFGGADAPETVVAEKFFAILISGETDGVRDLLSADAAIPEEALDPELYASATARPVKADAAEPVRAGGDTYVRVRCELAGDDTGRHLDLAFTNEGGEPKITGWRQMNLPVDPLTLPGGLRVGDTEFLLSAVDVTALTLLPGTYEISYVDPAGVGTTAAAGDGDGEPAVIEFPWTGEASPPLPSGFSATTGGIAVTPHLRPRAASALEVGLAADVAACTESGLRGATCPADLVDYVERIGESIDPLTVTWKPRREPAVAEPYTTWTFQAPYDLTFRSASGREWTAQPVLVGTLLSDGSDGFIFGRTA